MNASMFNVNPTVRVRVPAHQAAAPVEIPEHVVHVSLKEVAASITKEQVIELFCEARQVEASRPKKRMPEEKRRVIERAYLAAKRLADLPDEIKDLFWIVHGRALP